MDLGDIVTIEAMSVEVYDSDRHIPYPSVGVKLNRPALITFNNVDPKSKNTVEQKIEYLYKCASIMKVSQFYMSYYNLNRVNTLAMIQPRKYGNLECPISRSTNSETMTCKQFYSLCRQ